MRTFGRCGRHGPHHACALARRPRTRADPQKILSRAPAGRRRAGQLARRRNRSRRAAGVGAAVRVETRLPLVSRNERLAQRRLWISEQWLFALHLGRLLLPKDSSRAPFLWHAQHKCEDSLGAGAKLWPDSIPQWRLVRPITPREAPPSLRFHGRGIRKRVRLPALPLSLQRPRRLGRLVRS